LVTAQALTVLVVGPEYPILTCPTCDWARGSWALHRSLSGARRTLESPTQLLLLFVPDPSAIGWVSISAPRALAAASGKPLSPVINRLLPSSSYRLTLSAPRPPPVLLRCAVDLCSSAQVGSTYRSSNPHRIAVSSVPDVSSRG